MPESRKLRVFLCHASQDKPIVRELYQRLNAEGWINPWLDEEKLLPGQDWDLEIEKALRSTEAVIVCLSTNSVDREGYIQHEIRLALRVAGFKPEGVIFVIPIRLDDCSIPMRLELQHYVDFFPEERREWALQRLLQALQARYKQMRGSSLEEHSKEGVEQKTEIEAKKDVLQRKGAKQESLSDPRSSQNSSETSSETTEPELTAMQIAWQEAMDRANKRRKPANKESRKLSSTEEDILNRTLEKRLPTRSKDDSTQEDILKRTLEKRLPTIPNDD